MYMSIFIFLINNKFIYYKKRLAQLMEHLTNFDLPNKLLMYTKKN